MIKEKRGVFVQLPLTTSHLSIYIFNYIFIQQRGGAAKKQHPSVCEKQSLEEHCSTWPLFTALCQQHCPHHLNLP